jgi:NADP-dependent 3-hydroxy acid dehydrogenase YdfG
MPNENRSFAGKVAFVTGAANGIGRALEGRQDGVFLEALATLVGACVAGFGTRPGTP